MCGSTGDDTGDAGAIGVGKRDTEGALVGRKVPRPLKGGAMKIGTAEGIPVGKAVVGFGVGLAVG